MGSLTTAMVGPNQQTLAPGPVAGADAGQVLVVNLDLENTVNLGSSPTNLIFPLGPLASTVLTAPVFAAAATEPLLVGIAPGGASYSPGSLTITGPVTAEITGPVTVEGTVDIGSTVTATITGTVDADVSGTVDIGAGSVTFTNDEINIIGLGGYVSPGAYTLLLNDTTAHTVAAFGSYTTAILNVQAYSSYTVQVQAACPNQTDAGAPLCVPVVASYYADSAGDILVDSERWWMWVNAGDGTPLVGSGPLRGGWMSLTIGNPTGSQPVVTSDINLYGAGRPLDQSVWQQTPPIDMTANVFQLPSVSPLVPMPGDDKILADESSNNLATASQTYWLPLPLFAGTVSFYFQTADALASPFVVASAQGLTNGGVVAGGGANGVVWLAGNTVGTVYTGTAEVGNAPLYAVVHAPSGSTTFTFTAQGS